MAKAKIKWVVSEASTGRYRSFERRSWPSAHYNDEQEIPCASIHCEDEYRPAQAKSGEHNPLEIRIADHSASPSWTWRKLKARAATLDEAKALVKNFLEQHQEMMPEAFRDQAKDATQEEQPVVQEPERPRG